jgi:hypothetical protein
MTNFEYELNKQRQAQAIHEAEAHHLAQQVASGGTSLRQVLGRQLVKLGERLQADASQQNAAHQTDIAYETF